VTLVAIIGVLLVAAGLVLWSRNRAQGPSVLKTDGPLHVETAAKPQEAALTWAANNFPGIHSEVCQIGPTGSMRPLLEGGEWVVLAHDFAGVKLGLVVAYVTVGGSSPAHGSRLVHRIAAGDASGWLPKGDLAGMPLEDWNPITKQNYIGTLVAVFKQA